MTFNFGQAIEYLKEGKRVTRSGWNGKNMWLGLETPRDLVGYERQGSGSRMTLPFIYMFTATQDYVPWLASQTDILAEDWELVE